MKRMQFGTALLGVLAAAGVANAEYKFNGAVNTDWANSGNWVGGAVAPTDDSGNWIDNISPVNGLTLNNSKRTGGMAIRNAVSVNVNNQTFRADWISVAFATGHGAAYINGGGNFQSYNNFTWSAAAGDTLVVNCYYKPVGSNNRNNTINGGGTVVLNNSIDHDNKQINVAVSGGTTFVNNWWIGTVSAGSITVASDSRYAGNGNTGVATTTISGTVSPSSGGNTDSGVGTLNFNNALTINGTYAVDVTATTCDKVAPVGALTLGANSRLVVSGTASAKVYEIATYGSLSGTFKASTSVLPAGYKLDYAYASAKKIALVKQDGSTVLLLK